MNDMLSYFYAMHTCYQFMPQADRDWLADWEKVNLDGGTVKTSDWPGWAKYIGKMSEPIAKDQRDRSGFVYLMRNSRNGYTKIGFSQDPKRREVTLQAQEPEVEMVKAFPLDRAVERKLHSQYEKFRTRGEWFNLSPEQVAEIVRTLEVQT